MGRRGGRARPEISKGAQPPGDVPTTFAWVEPDELRQRADFLVEISREPAPGRGETRRED